MSSPARIDFDVAGSDRRPTYSPTNAHLSGQMDFSRWVIRNAHTPRLRVDGRTAADHAKLRSH
jgi:hypothetical protein